MRSPPKAKILPLEALRGMAAFVVVFHHFTLSFLPRLIGMFDFAGDPHALLGTPLYAFLNGKGMQVLFFVLSGYVLALRGLKPDTGPGLAFATLRRWLRLAPLVCLSVLLSWGLFNLGLYHFVAAGELSHSEWLMHMAFGSFNEHYRPTLAYSLYQGLVGVFVVDNSFMNTNLWTMRWEFYGSILIFALLALVAPSFRRKLGCVLPLIAVALFMECVWMLPFLAGLLAVALRPDRIKLGRAATFILLIVAIYFCAYYTPIGWYAWAAWLPTKDVERQVLVLTVGGFLMLFLFATDNCISRRFTGGVSRLLGEISFPLYLVHTLLIASFSSWGYLKMGGGEGGLLAALILLVVTATPLVAFMAWFDLWWLAQLPRLRFKRKSAVA